MKKTCCFTGDRPEKLTLKLFEGNPDCKILKELMYRQAENLIVKHGVTRFLTGMGRGVDTYAAEIVLELRKKYPVVLECVLPYEAQAAHWLEKERNRYFANVAKADRETVMQPRYSPGCQQKRNRHMVDQSGYVIAVWGRNKGNTAQTFVYAQQRGRNIILIDPLQLTVTSIANNIDNVYQIYSAGR